MSKVGEQVTQGVQQVRSKDGTVIAYQRSGSGPVVIVVSAALADRTGTRRFTRELAPNFTVVDYDRRGRGASGDTRPYAIEREVEDIEALIDENGGRAHLFGSSSGAVLALEAANRLVGKVEKLALFEPPFIVDDSRPPLPPDLPARVDALVAADRRSAVVKLFFSKAVGIPRIFVALMVLMPGWSTMKAAAHTLPYDLTVLDGTQNGRPLSSTRWANVRAPALVLTGERSGAFFHSGADALAGVLPEASHQILRGQSHAAVVMRPQSIAPLLVAFFAH
ncbi:alpha/beta fold hydrolase [Streptacidiphilus sp. EB129]|uniref:alpha/beta fold hydrolase n=1 Tax=Streptacidiphilus sp. EB129 TaxID=3156262 RepID=UPI0035169BFC